jgi:hypothetical protein
MATKNDKKQEKRDITVQAYPYAMTMGKIQVPSDITGQEAITKYVFEHFDEVRFDPPVLDYKLTDFDVYE